MIPIQSAPKRFRAALNATRFHFLKRSCSTLDSITISSRNISSNATAAAIHLHDKHTIKNNNNSNKNSIKVFPTVKLPQIALEEKEKSTLSPIGSLYGQRNAYWWTGLNPLQCPGFEKDGILYSLPQFSFNNDINIIGAKTKEDLQKYFDNTWTLTEVLLSSLQGEEAFHVPPYHDLRHPLIFYYGHPAALYVNKLRVAGLLKEPINQYYEVIFETGVDEMSWDDLSKNKMPWPSVAEVHSYRKKSLRGSDECDSIINR